MDNILAVSVGSAAAVIYLAAIVFAIVQIQRTADLARVEKIIWAVAVLCAPVLGALVWYAAGPHPFGLRVTRDHR